MRPSGVRIHSVRAMLTIWNTVTFAVVLVALGIVFRFLARGYLLSGLDREIRSEAARIQRARVPDRLYVMESQISSTFAVKVIKQDTVRVTAGRTFPPDHGTQIRIVRDMGVVLGDGSGQLLYRSFDLDGNPLSGSVSAVKYDHVLASDVAVSESPQAQQYRPWDMAALSRAKHGGEWFTTVELLGAPLRIMSIPLKEGDEVIGVGQIAAPLTPLYRDIAGLTRTLFLVLPPALLVSGLAGVFLTERALRPVKSLTRAARQIQPDQLAARLPLNGAGEFDELAATFNSALSRVEGAFVERERMMEQLRRFTGDASHELRTPLTSIKANTGVALAETEPSLEHIHALRQIDKAANRMTSLVDDLLLLARYDGNQLPLDSRPVSLAETIAEAIELLPAQGNATARIDTTKCENGLVVFGDSEQLVRLFRNLLENAVRYTPADGLISVSAQASPGLVFVSVTDTGSGIAAVHLPHLGERLYRADMGRNRLQGGSGLGLAICKSILTRHNGSMKIESQEGIGTTVTVTLPANL